MKTLHIQLRFLFSDENGGSAKPVEVKFALKTYIANYIEAKHFDSSNDAISRCYLSSIHSRAIIDSHRILDSAHTSIFTFKILICSSRCVGGVHI